MYHSKYKPIVCQSVCVSSETIGSYKLKFWGKIPFGIKTVLGNRVYLGVLQSNPSSIFCTKPKMNFNKYLAFLIIFRLNGRFGHASQFSWIKHNFKRTFCFPSLQIAMSYSSSLLITFQYLYLKLTFCFLHFHISSSSNISF